MCSSDLFGPPKKNTLASGLNRTELNEWSLMAVNHRPEPNESDRKVRSLALYLATPRKVGESSNCLD